MSEGRSLKVQSGWIETFFDFDSNGALFPKKESLRTKEVASKIAEQVARDRNLGRDMTRRAFSTDVEFAFRPNGSTPVITDGIRSFGPSPLRRLPFKGKISGMDLNAREGKGFRQRCEARARRVDNFVADARNTVETLETTSEAEVALKEVERDQVNTGGGYDNTEAFSITKSLLGFLEECSHEAGEPNSELSQLVVKHSLALGRELQVDLGIPLGSLHYESFMLVRLMQESDGMIGYPVFAKSSKELTPEIALRLSVWSGVDCRFLVNKTVKGISEEGSIMRVAQVVDAMCYVLDSMIAHPQSVNFAAIIWTLARIQRHGYKEVEGEYKAKDGKARSVSPNAALSGAEEAQSGDPFIKLMKEKKCPWMPSLQDHETADDLIWTWYESRVVPKDMRALPADWSGYDKTVKGWILATILYYVVRPLYDFESQKWFDLAIVSLVFKYFLVNRDCAEANPEEWAIIQKAYQVENVNDDFVLVGTYNGLGSGAKLTHVGGSLYGEVVIHHCIPELLGYEGISGPQAGDDTSLAVPMSMIDLSSAQKTYQPIADAAERFGLKMNTSKQMWVVGANEVMNIFLQYSYNWNLQIKGIGTAVRYYVAYPFAEREKFLTTGEQYMAVISKFNNGVTNPWIKIWLRKWLERDHYIAAIFKEYGDQAFHDVLVASIGASLTEVSKRLELSYNWGLKPEQLEQGDIPVLALIAEVAQTVEPGVSAAEAIAQLDLIHQNEKLRRDSPDVYDSNNIDEGYGLDENEDAPNEE